MSEEARLPRWLKLANPVIVALQRRGVVIGTMRLLSVPGRKSGKLRTIPVSPLTVEGERYIIAGLEEADWVKNLRSAGWGILARGRDQERVNLVESALQKSSKRWRADVRCSGWRRLGRDLIRVDPRWVLQHLMPGVGIPE